MSVYRTARRKLASLLNGILISTVGAKIVPAKPASMSYRRVSTRNGCAVMEVSLERQAATVHLREGTADWMTFDQIFIEEDYDLRRLTRIDELKKIYRAIVSSGKAPLIVDLGANIGLSAIYFKLVWPEAIVLAVEPDRENVELLHLNVGRIDGIQVLEAAAASCPGRLRIKDPEAGKNAVQVVGIDEGAGDEVDCVTLPDLFERMSDRCVPFIVKIDIEGGEKDLFAANFEWIDDVPLMVVELHDWLFPRARTSRNFLAAIANKNRDFVYIDENIFSISNK